MVFNIPIVATARVHFIEHACTKLLYVRNSAVELTHVKLILQVHLSQHCLLLVS